MTGRKKTKAAQRGVPDMGDGSKLTPESFEKELKDLAAKARQETTFKHVQEQASVVVKVATLLTLAAIYSNISQLTLSPVYGGIPSAIWHPQGVMVSCFLGWAGHDYLVWYLPSKPMRFLPVMAISIPTIQFFLFKISLHLGATWGPVITEAITFMPLLLLSVSCTATVFADLDLSRINKHVADAGPGVGSYIFYKVMESYSGTIINGTIGSTFVQTRLGLQIVLGAVYSIFAPSKLLLYALPAMLHTAVFNTHVQSPWATHSLNTTLAKSGYELLARHDSLTGYISVLDSQKDGFRVMRCDHSLLGGEWRRIPGGGYPAQVKVKEPIYAIFAMLEAVRLVEVPVTIADSDANALVIGLGIGTTPAALMAHGIDTTIVEIDPIVFEYAIKYFGLPEGHTPVIEDAVSYASYLAQNTTQTFDYIVHDVFTGGAEPVDLFTVEFMTDLYSLLKPNGVAAINYAGDLLLPSARLIVRTIKSVFPSCRIYREMAAPSAATLAIEKQDFTNMVIFCTKSSDPITFRQIVEQDYLDSGARRQYLNPKYEIRADLFEELNGDGEILSRNDTARLTQWQQKSAVGHWNVMRTVIPDDIWQSW